MFIKYPKVNSLGANKKAKDVSTLLTLCHASSQFSACNTLLSSIIQVRSHPTRAAYCKCDKERTVRKLMEGWGEGGNEVQKIDSCKGKFTKEIGYILTQNYSGASPLGHFYFIDTSIQGTQNLVPEKRPPNLCI